MDNNILTISEKTGMAYLPYKYREVEKIYEDSDGKYISTKEVIDTLYTIPLEKFNNASYSRFREAFNLVRYKEKKSIIFAFDIALEMMFNYKLNPIIIAACKNLNELDIYLDCLEENELFDFPFFKINFEVAPEIYKSPLEKCNDQF